MIVSVVEEIFLFSNETGARILVFNLQFYTLWYMIFRVPSILSCSNTVI